MRKPSSYIAEWTFVFIISFMPLLPGTIKAQDVVLTLKNDAVNIFQDGRVYKSNDPINLLYEYSNKDEIIRRTVKIVNETQREVPFTADTKSRFFRHISGSPQGDFSISPGESQLIVINWAEVELHNNEYTIRYQVFGGKFIRFILKRKKQGPGPESPSVTSQSQDDPRGTEATPVSQQLTGGSIQFHPGNIGNEPTEKIFTIKNDFNYDLRFNYKVQPETLSDYIKVRRQNWDKTGYEEIPQDKTKVLKRGERSIEISYKGNYRESKPLTGQITFYDQGRQVSVIYKVGIDAYSDGASVFEKEVDRLNEKLNDFPRLKTENRELKKKVEELKNAMMAWQIGLLVAAVLGVLLGFIFSKRRRKQVRKPHRSYRAKADSLELEDEVKALRLKNNRLEDVANKASVQTSENDREADALRAALKKSEEDYKALTLEYGSQKAVLDQQQIAFDRLNEELSVYKEDQFLQKIRNHFNETTEEEKEEFLRTLLPAPEEENIPDITEEVATPVHLNQDVLTNAKEKARVLNNLVELSTSTYKGAKDLLGSEHKHLLKELHDAYRTNITSYKGELEYFFAYANWMELTPGSQVEKVFDIWGIEQSEEHAISTLSSYAITEFYPLISRTLVFLKEAEVLFKQAGKIDLKNSLVGKSDQIIEGLSKVLQIQIHQVALLNRYEDQYKNFCFKVDERKLSDADFDSRKSFYESIAVPSDHIKAILYIGYSNIGQEIRDEQRTRVIIAR